LARNAATRSPSISYVDLDNLMKAKDPALFYHNGDRWQDFWTLARSCFRELRSAPSSQIHLIDVGAGCLKTVDALAYFTREPSVVVTLADPASSFRRAQARPNGYWSSRTLAEYSREEYSPERMRFYDAARYKLEVSGLDERAAVRRFNDLLANIVDTTF